MAQGNPGLDMDAGPEGKERLFDRNNLHETGSPARLPNLLSIRRLRSSLEWRQELMNKFAISSAAALALSFAGCSEQPAAKTEQKTVSEKPEPASGQSAVFRMYQVARTWAPDAQILKLNSMHVTDVPETPGKAGAWEGVFVSPAKSASRPYTWSAVEEQPTLHKGVFAGAEQPFSASRGTSPFLIAAVKVDSDAAYKTAKTKAADYEKKNPNLPITFVLEKLDKFPDPAWRVVWGESVGTSGFSVYIDASTGAYLETMH
jgi:hypothetical protein